MLIEMSDTMLGRNILYLRKKSKLSRIALAKHIGITVYTLKKWEDESMYPILSNEQLQRICEIFDVPSEDMVHKNLEEIAATH